MPQRFRLPFTQRRFFALGLCLIALTVGAGYIAPRARGVYALTRITQRPAFNPNIPHLTPVWTGRSYAYVVWPAPGASGITLIDTGSDGNAKALLTALAQGGAQPSAVHAILLTHGHEDHTAGLAMFPQATLHASHADGALLRGDIGPRAALMRLVMRLMPRQRHARPITPLWAAQHLNLGGHTFDIIALPGHTPGSLGIAWQDGVFTGDAVSTCTSTPLELRPYPSALADNPLQSQHVITRLNAYPVLWLADGHCGFTRFSARQTDSGKDTR